MSSMSKLVFQLVTWNGADIVGQCLQSLEALEGGPYQVIVIDNDSQDGTPEIISVWAAKTRHHVLLLQMRANTGFAGGHNFAFRLSELPLVCLLNQDVLVAPEFAECALEYFDQHADVAGISPLIFSLRDDELTDHIDTAGLQHFRSGRVVDWRQGEEWRDGLIVEQAVFGVSGALPLFRRAALIGVARDGNIFDSRFNSYKEDVDLAWRLAARNTAIMFVPRVQAWHRRTARGGVDLTDRAATGNRRTKLTRVNALSWRNHWYVLLKSVPRDFWRRNWPFILWYELKKFIWLCLFERATLKQLPAVVKFWWQR